jgi:hypothetical protein
VPDQRAERDGIHHEIRPAIRPFHALDHPRRQLRHATLQQETHVAGRHAEARRVEERLIDVGDRRVHIAIADPHARSNIDSVTARRFPRTRPTAPRLKFPLDLRAHGLFQILRVEDEDLRHIHPRQKFVRHQHPHELQLFQPRFRQVPRRRR